MAHHYEAVLKPPLADLDPAQKASTIGGYVADTGITPDAATKTLLAMTVTGDPASRIAAARALTDIFDIDPQARDSVPPPLADLAGLLRRLADTDTIPPEDIVNAADALFRDGAKGTNQPNPALLQLATAEIDAEDTAGNKDDVFFGEDAPFPEDDDGAADSLVAEFRSIRDGLAEEGNNDSASLAGSVDALMGAIEERDPDGIERQIGQLEDRVARKDAPRSGGAVPVQLAALDETGLPQAARLPRIDPATILRLLDGAKRFLRNLGRGPRQRRPNPDQPNKDGVIIPKPPSAPDGAGQPEEQERGIGDNQPPSSLEDGDERREILQDVELSPGITVRGDPSSTRWNNFKEVLGRLSGKSRDAAESLINGGDLTTGADTRKSVANITRKGGLKESTEAYEEAVRKAGGDPTKVLAKPQPNAIIRRFTNPEDGTRFVHRQPIGTDNLAVEVQIVRRTRLGSPRPEIDHRIKIRFE